MDFETLVRWLLRDPVAVAPDLLGAVLTHTTPEGTVGVRLTEVEAYRGHRDSDHPDPGSHSYNGRTPRNEVMWGPPGHLYVYFTYGMHFCANVVCGPAGSSSGCLLRAGEIVEGIDLARSRRSAARRDADLARGPARLAQALSIGRDDNGATLDGASFRLEPPAHRAAGVLSGPRVGVAGEGGSADYLWRFWLPGEPSVSTYRAAKPRPARG
ncbi:DNA-3-methyladenine glycosylase [Sinomonas sp. ASV486]|uniref:Putative 3-methyladenine DNA glycosylase n=1 Tax=Sinomonas puerhi TaxID=3238584 RepID=A0AB39L7H0_9MICC|nr:DNA-3-methyladenine glycosylase [Sinomonas sp. ASV486]MDQ4492213.1 DNA-3-methyladenine glycosylase [Sinomonas sp. ASV486]